MLENVIKKLFPIRDENNRPCTFPTFASQVFFDDGSVLEGKEFGSGTATVDPLDKFEIGVIYHFAIDVNPPEKYGGKWEKINGRILIGTGTPEANSDGTSPGSYDYELNIKGGEAAHALTVNELAGHDHGPGPSGSNWTPNAHYSRQLFAPNGQGTHYVLSMQAADNYVQGNTGKTGGNQAHNNMPPYLAVNMWKRVS